MKHADRPDFSFARGRHLLAALSGGADSVALLCMLAEAAGANNITLSAAHVDHCIRPESAEDAEFCRKLCEELKVGFHLVRIDVPALAKGEGLETAARRLRYEALRKIRREIGADWIALAHHLDDQAETVLMHLLRGCGPEGVGGMDVLSGDLYRPLLTVPKRALEEYLALYGRTWRVDSTNSDPFTPRNALRLHGLPALEESYPKAASALARYAEAARCEDAFMRRQTDAFMRAHFETGLYGSRLTDPGQADEAILRRALRRICGEDTSHDRLTALAALCAKKRGKMSVRKGITAERTPGAIYFLPNAPVLPEPVALDVDGVTVLPGVGRMTVCAGEAVPIRDNPFRQALRRDALAGAVLRLRQSGDCMRPLGCGNRLLSDVLTDRKIDRPLRDVLPLVAVGSRVLWAVGVGISEDAALRPGDEAALLTWQPDAI